MSSVTDAVLFKGPEARAASEIDARPRPSHDHRFMPCPEECELGLFDAYDIQIVPRGSREERWRRHQNCPITELKALPSIRGWSLVIEVKASLRASSETQWITGDALVAGFAAIASYAERLSSWMGCDALPACRELRYLDTLEQLTLSGEHSYFARVDALEGAGVRAGHEVRIGSDSDRAYRAWLRRHRRGGGS